MRLAIDARVREEVLHRRARDFDLQSADDAGAAVLRDAMNWMARADAARRPPSEEEIRAYFALQPDTDGPGLPSSDGAPANSDPDTPAALLVQAVATSIEQRHHDAASEFRIVFDRRVPPPVPDPAAPVRPAGDAIYLSIREFEAGRYSAELILPDGTGEPATADLDLDGCVSEPAERVTWSGGASIQRVLTCDGRIAGRTLSVTGTLASDAPVHILVEDLDRWRTGVTLVGSAGDWQVPARPSAMAGVSKGLRLGGWRVLSLPALWLLALVTVLLTGTRHRPALATAGAFGAAHAGAVLLASRDELYVAPYFIPVLLAGLVAVSAIDFARGREAARKVAGPPWLLALFVGAIVGAGLRVTSAATPGVALGTGIGATLAILAPGVVAILLARYLRTPEQKCRAGALFLAAAIALASPGVAEATRYAATPRLLPVVEPALTAMLAGVAVRLIGGASSRFPLPLFLLLVAAGTSLPLDALPHAWVRILAIVPPFLLAGTMSFRTPEPRDSERSGGGNWGTAGPVTFVPILVAAAAVGAGWHMRVTMQGTAAFDVPIMAGATVTAALLFLAGLHLAGEVAASDRAIVSRRLGLGGCAFLVSTRLIDYAIDLPALLTGPLAKGTIPVPVLSLLAAAAGVLFWPRRRRIAEALGYATPRRATHVVLLGAAFLLLPLGIVEASNPFARQASDPTDVHSTVHNLLTNTYLAFNLADEQELYDRLAESVVEELVADLYLDSRRRLAAGTVDGDEVSIEQVVLLELEEIQGSPRSGDQDRAFDTRWRVDARVRHLGHVHHRQNTYTGTVHLRSLDGRPRLSAVTLTGEERILASSRRR